MASPAATIDSDRLLPRRCPVCHSQQSSAVFQTIRKCQDCGLRYVAPLGHFRGEHESQEYFVNEYLPLHQSNWENSLAERRAHLSLIRKYSGFASPPRLLDVGCALGFMLRESRSLGWEAVGVETSEFAARYAAEHTRCDVYTGTLQEAHFSDGSFDVVTLMDVIEHVPDPCSLLNEVFRVLRPGGTLFLVTPNFGSFFVWLYGESAYGIGPEEHVTYFHPASLRRALRSVGFRNIVIGTKDFYAENLRRFLRRRDAHPSADIKAAFAGTTFLGNVRRALNRVLMRVRVGDKLIALGRKGC